MARAVEYTLRQRFRRPICDKYGYPTSQWYWSEWEWLCFVEAGKIGEALRYWRDLNDYAVSARGEGARRDFSVVEGLPYE